jgi:hypothetical protein
MVAFRESEEARNIAGAGMHSLLLPRCRNGLIVAAEVQIQCPMERATKKFEVNVLLP